MTHSIERLLIDGVWTTVDVEESAGGGYPDAVGFAVHQSASQVGIANGGRWLPDVEDYASAEWTVDLGAGTFTVTDEALYAVAAEYVVRITSGTADEVWATIGINSTRWNVDPITVDMTNPVNALSAAFWRGSTMTVIPLGPDCQIAASIGFTGLTANVVAQSYLRAFKIAELP